MRTQGDFGDSMCADLDVIVYGHTRLDHREISVFVAPFYRRAGAFSSPSELLCAERFRGEVCSVIHQGCEVRKRDICLCHDEVHDKKWKRGVHSCVCSG